MPNGMFRKGLKACNRVGCPLIAFPLAGKKTIHVGFFLLPVGWLAFLARSKDSCSAWQQLRVGLNGLNKLALFLVQLLGGVAGQTQKDRKLFVRHKVDPLSEDGAGRRVFICRRLRRGLFIQQASQRILRIFAWRDGFLRQQGGAS